jgi:hypothetical protein
MFVVLVTHNTGHGEVADVIQLTRNIKKVIKTARSVEKLGYEFYSNEVGVEVLRLKPERRPFKKYESKFSPGCWSPLILVFYRQHSKSHQGDHSGDCWTEEWFDDNLKKAVDGKKK